jgi:hypothetical protein
MKVINPLKTEYYVDTQRSTVGTYFDKNRVLRQKVINPNYASLGEGLNTTTGVRDNWNPATGVYEGLMLEFGRTNEILNNESLTNIIQTRSLSPGTYALSFYGTGSIKIEAPGTTTFILTGSPLTTPTFTVETAVAPSAAACPVVRVHQSFSTSGGSVVITVTGTVRFAQLELGANPTSIIVTGASPVARTTDEISSSGIITGTSSNVLESIGDAFLFPSSAYYDPVTDLYTSYSRFVLGNTYSIGNKVVYLGRRFTALVNGVLPAPLVVEGQGTSDANWNYTDLDNCALAYVRNSSGAMLSTDYFDLLTTYHVTAFLAPFYSSSVAIHNIVSSETTVVINDSLGNINTYVYGIDTTDLFIEFPQSGQRNVVTIRVRTPISSGISGGATKAAIGEIVVGKTVDLGQTQYGVSTSITDYSKKNTDDFGNTTFVKRAFSKKLSARMLLDKSAYNTAVQAFYDLRASPTSWIATDDESYNKGAIIYGYYKDFSMDISYPTMCACSLEIEGLA